MSSSLRYLVISEDQYSMSSSVIDDRSIENMKPPASAKFIREMGDHQKARSRVTCRFSSSLEIASMTCFDCKRICAQRGSTGDTHRSSARYSTISTV